MTMYAKMNKADIVLIAGDLFDSDYITKDAVNLLLHEFENNPTCKFVISPGDTDYYSDASVYGRISFPDNVYIFTSDVLSYFSFDDIGADVYGYAFMKPTLETNPFAGVKPQNSQTINILCGHGTLAVTGDKCPIKLSDIEYGGFDYIALGHDHNSSGIKRAGGVCYAYSGAVQGRNYDEPGHKGAVWLEVEKGNVSGRGVRFSTRRYESVTVDAEGAETAAEVMPQIRRAISDNKFGEDTLLKIKLTGDVYPEFSITGKFLREQLKNLCAVELDDYTLPIYGCQRGNDNTAISKSSIKGMFLERMLRLIEENSRGEETPAEAVTAARALRCGLAALRPGMGDNPR
jgi:DNA repair exonuclease SbcCD nuclease subunit